MMLIHVVISAGLEYLLAELLQKVNRAAWIKSRISLELPYVCLSETLATSLEMPSCIPVFCLNWYYKRIILICAMQFSFGLWQCTKAQCKWQIERGKHMIRCWGNSSSTWHICNTNTRCFLWKAWHEDAASDFPANRTACSNHLWYYAYATGGNIKSILHIIQHIYSGGQGCGCRAIFKSLLSVVLHLLTIASASDNNMICPNQTQLFARISVSSAGKSSGLCQDTVDFVKQCARSVWKCGTYVLFTST